MDKPRSHSVGTTVELDYSNNASDTLADFGDTDEGDDKSDATTSFRHLINIEEASSSDENIELPEEAYSDNFTHGHTNVILRLSPKIHIEAISWLVEKITQTKKYGGGELILKCEPMTKNKEMVFHISASEIRYLEVAEFLELKKMDIRGNLREFQVKDLDSFLQGRMFVEDLITPAEKTIIVLHELQNIRVLPGEICIPGYPEVTTMPGQSWFSVYVQNKLIKEFYPLHDDKQLKEFSNFGIRDWLNNFLSGEPFEKIRRYFGDSITLCFLFSGFYTMFLIPMVVFNVVVSILPLLNIINANMQIAVISAVNLIWVMIFLKLWRRRCSEFSYNWGTIKMSRWEEPRLTYRGRIAVDPVTGQYQPRYPWWKTGVKIYLVSLPVTLLAMMTTGSVLYYYLWVDYFTQTFKKFNDGSWFGLLMKHAPAILYSLTVMLMTKGYRRLAVALTEWENHRTQSQYEKYRVAKLVYFEFVNYFMSLFFIAFVLQDVQKLRHQLRTMLLVQHIVVVFVEIVLPRTMRQTTVQLKKFLEKMSTESRMLLHPREQTKAVDATYATPADFKLDVMSPLDHKIQMHEFQLTMAPYKGDFDDYLQLFVQFGYIFLFSPILPEALLYATLLNPLVIYGNIYKLCEVLQRPNPTRAKSIGTWQTAFEVFGIVCVMTNCAFIALFTNIKSAYFDSWSNQHFYFFLVFCEHVVVALILLVYNVIPDVPYWVKIGIAKMEYKARMAYKKEQHRESRRRWAKNFKAINLGLYLRNKKEVGSNSKSHEGIKVNSTSSRRSNKTTATGATRTDSHSRPGPSSSKPKTSGSKNTYRDNDKESPNVETLHGKEKLS